MKGDPKPRAPANWKTPPAAALLVRPEAARVLLSVGKDKLREILPELETFMRGRARFITRASIDRWIAANLENAA